MTNETNETRIARAVGVSINNRVDKSLNFRKAFVRIWAEHLLCRVSCVDVPCGEVKLDEIYCDN